MDFFNPLDSMCEVVMEESDDAPVSLPTDDGNFDLPPIPTFDLQSEQFTYLPPVPQLHTTPTIRPFNLVPKRVASNESNDGVSKIRLPLKPVERKIRPKPVEDLKLSPNAERTHFLEKLFNPKLFGKVFSSPDEYPKNLQLTTVDEMKYYSEHFSDATSKVELCRLHCTICDKHMGCSASGLSNAKAHRMLCVLVCKNCFEFYGDGIFPTDKSDNTEVYCRWCGQGGDLVCCSYCPKVFCYKCVKRNFDMSYLKQIQDVSDWACFCCAQTPLWPLRAVCRALLFYLKNQADASDNSICCVKKGRARKSVAILPKGPQLKEAERPGPVQNPMVVFHAGMKKYGQTLPGTSIQKGDTTIRPPRHIRPAAAAPLRGLTPMRPSTLSRAPQSGVRPPQAMVRMPPQQVPARMPEVLVNHSKLDDMVVRLRMPNNKEQYLRVKVSGSCMRIPDLPPNPSFPVRSLKDAFRASRMAFSCLLSISEKAEKTQASRKNDAEHAEALLTMLDRWKSAIGFIEDDVKRNLSIHRKREQQKNNDVIDLDDEEEEEKMQWNFDVRSKDIFDEDSEVEIIDDDDEVPAAPAKRKRDDQGTAGPPSKISRSTRLTNGQQENAQDGSQDSRDNSVDDGSGSKTASADEGDDSRETIPDNNSNLPDDRGEEDKTLPEESLQNDADASMDASKDPLEAGEIENSNDSLDKEEGETEEPMEEETEDAAKEKDSTEESGQDRTKKDAESGEEGGEKDKKEGSGVEDADNSGGRERMEEGTVEPTKEAPEEKKVVGDEHEEKESGGETVKDAFEEKKAEEEEKMEDKSKAESEETGRRKEAEDCPVDKKRETDQDEDERNSGHKKVSGDHPIESVAQKEASGKSPKNSRVESQNDDADLLKLLDGELALLGNSSNPPQGDNSADPLANIDDSGELSKMEQSLLDEIDNVT